MALKDQAINLVLRARNLLSGATDAAANSVEALAGSAEGLKGKLRELEDNGALVRNFQQAEKAVTRTSAAYDRARLRADKLADKIGSTGVVTERQAQEFEAARKAVDAAEKEYQRAEKTLGELGDEARDAGIDLEDLNGEQRRIAEETRKARRAMADLADETNETGQEVSRLGGFLSSGTARFVAWTGAAVAAGKALVVGTLTRFAAGQADLARQTLASAQAFGVSAVELQKWQYAAEEVGIGGEKVADIMKDVAEKIGDAYLNGAGEAREVIQGLGLDLGKLAQLRPDEQILAISERLEGMPKAGQVQILEALASDASLLLPLLDNNAQRLRELSAAAEERGVILSEDELENLAAAEKSFRDLINRVKGFGAEIAGRLAPTFTKLSEAIDKALADKPKLLDTLAERFEGLIESTGEWILAVVENAPAISAAFSGVVSTLTGLGQTFTAVFSGVQTVIATVLEFAARSAYSLQNIYTSVLRGLESIGVVSAETVREAEYRLENLGALVLDLDAKAEGYKDRMVAAGTAAATAFSQARDGAAQLARATAEATREAVGLSAASEQAGAAAEGAADGVDRLASTQEGLARQIAETVQAIEAASQAWRDDPSEENLARLDELRARYAELQEALADLRVPEVRGVEEFKNSLDEIKEKAEETGDAVQNAGNHLSELGDEAEVAGDTVEETGERAQAAAESAGSAIADIFTGWTNRLFALSDAAGRAFQQALGGQGVADTADALSSRLEAVNRQIADLRHSVGEQGLARAMGDIAEKGLEVERLFLNQAMAAEELTESINSGDRSLRVMGLTADQVKQRFNLLDDTRLNTLLGSIQSVQREVESLKDSLDDTIASAEQELAGLRGDTAEVERLRYQEKALELQEQLNRARATGDAEAVQKAQRALELAEEAHRIRLENAKAQAEEAREQEARRAADAERDRQRDEVEERQDIARVEQRAQAQINQISRPNRTVRVQFVAPDNLMLGEFDAVDDRMVDAFLDRIENAGLVVPR